MIYVLYARPIKLEIVRFLLEKGNKIDDVDVSGTNVLLYASQNP